MNYSMKTPHQQMRDCFSYLCACRGEHGAQTLGLPRAVLWDATNGFFKCPGGLKFPEGCKLEELERTRRGNGVLQTGGNGETHPRTTDSPQITTCKGNKVPLGVMGLKKHSPNDASVQYFCTIRKSCPIAAVRKM